MRFRIVLLFMAAVLLVACGGGSGGSGGSGSSTNTQSVPFDIQLTIQSENHMFEQAQDGSPKGTDVTIAWAGTLGPETAFHIRPITDENGHLETFRAASGETTHTIRLDTTFQVETTRGERCDLCEPVEVEVDYSDLKWGIIDVPGGNFVIWKTDFDLPNSVHELNTEGRQTLDRNRRKNEYELGRYFSPKMMNADFVTILSGSLTASPRHSGFEFGLDDDYAATKIYSDFGLWSHVQGAVEYHIHDNIIHEIGHRWAQRLRSPEFEGVGAPFPRFGETWHGERASNWELAHWGITSVYGTLGGFDWDTLQAHGAGRYSAKGHPGTNSHTKYSPMTRYLMGAISESELKTELPVIQWAENGLMLREENGTSLTDERGYFMFSADSIEQTPTADYLAAYLHWTCRIAYRLYDRTDGFRGRLLGAGTPAVYNACLANRGVPDGTFSVGFSTELRDRNKGTGVFKMFTVVFVDDQAVQTPTYETAMAISENIRFLSSLETRDDGRVTFHEATGGWGTLITDIGDDLIRSPPPRDHSRFESEESYKAWYESTYQTCRQEYENTPLEAYNPTLLCRRRITLDAGPPSHHHGQHSHSH